MRTAEYQNLVSSFDCHPAENKLHAHALGLCEEAGEFAGKLCKAHRKEELPDKRQLGDELGDVVWRVAALCNQLGYTMEHIMQMNIEKLTDRKQRGVIIGEGDDR
jgi:NTP pyrophosphatase (non-canonical NTP hydrolase)